MSHVYGITAQRLRRRNSITFTICLIKMDLHSHVVVLFYYIYLFLPLSSLQSTKDAILDNYFFYLTAQSLIGDIGILCMAGLVQLMLQHF